MSRFQLLIDGWLRGEVDPAPVAGLVGFRLTGFRDGVATVEMTAGARHHNPMGQVHGGILCDLADAAMGVAFAATLTDGESFVTLGLRIDFLRSVEQGLLSATGRVLHRGRNTGHVECEIVDDRGRLVARAASTCLVRGSRAASGETTP